MIVWSLNMLSIRIQIVCAADNKHDDLPSSRRLLLFNRNGIDGLGSIAGTSLFHPSIKYETLVEKTKLLEKAIIWYNFSLLSNSPNSFLNSKSLLNHQISENQCR